MLHCRDNNGKTKRSKDGTFASHAWRILFFSLTHAISEKFTNLETRCHNDNRPSSAPGLDRNMPPKVYKSAERIIDSNSDAEDAIESTPTPAPKPINKPQLKRKAPQPAQKVLTSSKRIRTEREVPQKVQQRSDSESSNEASEAGQQEENEKSQGGEGSGEESGSEGETKRQNERYGQTKSIYAHIQLLTIRSSQPSSQPPTNDHQIALNRSTTGLPPGFKKRKQPSRSDDQTTAFLKPSALAGKELWYITAPASVPLTQLKEVALEEVRLGNPVLSHEGSQYRFLSGKQDAGNELRMFLPDQTGETYQPGELNHIPPPSACST